MANQSSATGRFYFESHFFDKHTDFLTHYFNTVCLMANYGIEVSDINDNGSFQFVGIGRWSMQNTLDQIFMPIDDSSDESELWSEFRQMLINEQPQIILDYTDYECGNQLFTKEHVVLQYNAAKNIFDIQSLKLDNLNYSEASRINAEVEPGYFLDITNQHNQVADILTNYWRRQPVQFRIDHPHDIWLNQVFQQLANNPDFENGLCSYHLYDDDSIRALLTTLNDAA